jgi:hypothetical protein
MIATNVESEKVPALTQRQWPSHHNNKMEKIAKNHHGVFKKYAEI